MNMGRGGKMTLQYHFPYMVGRWRLQRKQDSQSQRFSSRSAGLGGRQTVGRTSLQRCKRSRCFFSSSVWADTRAASRRASFRKSRARVDRMLAFFCCTFEWASQESMGGGGGFSDLRARDSETERIVIAAIIGRIRGLALLAITLQ